MKMPNRLQKLAGDHALVDGIPFQLPVAFTDASAFLAAFEIDADRAAELLPGRELHPFRLLNGKGVLIITVVDYRETSIGAYIEYSIAIACTRGLEPAPRLLPAIFGGYHGLGQYVIDLPVSTEVSVKGGKGIWGMPKHQASLDFKVSDRTLSAQYDLDGQLAAYIEIEIPGKAWIPARASGVNYCSFRGMLMTSYIAFAAKLACRLLGRARGRFVVGDHPRLAPLKALEIGEKPFATVWMPGGAGTLDDHFEGWFLTGPVPPRARPEGLESVVDLGLGREWPPPPSAPVPERTSVSHPRGPAPRRRSNSTPVSLRLARWISVATLVAGAVQLLAPEFVLGTMSAATTPTSAHFFRIIGMFMMLFGGLCLHACRNVGPAAHVPLVWCALQKFGACIAVLSAVWLGLLASPALGVAGFDFGSGVLLWMLARRVRQ